MCSVNCVIIQKFMFHIIFQRNYNIAHCKTRVVIEQTFGVLKGRFACLSYGLRQQPTSAVQTITACVVLHNIGIARGDVYPRYLDQAVGAEDIIYNGPDSGSHYRDFIANGYF